MKRFNLIFYIIFLFTFCIQMMAQEKSVKNSTVSEMLAHIDTSIDSQYIYEYEQSKYVPPNGKTLLIMGQTVERINEYHENFKNQDMPSGWSAYWGIPAFDGIKKEHKNQTGSSQHHQMLVNKFPNTVIHSAMWMVGTWDVSKRTYWGEFDNILKEYSQWAKSINQPIFLRIGYEFDGPHNALEPTDYVRAFRHIVDYFESQNVNNIAYIWHSYASKPYKNNPLESWYPGDDYVDWVAISVFGHAYAGTDFGVYCDDVLNFAATHKKPVMIAESSPIKGIDPHDTKAWDEWFANLFSFSYNKNIKALSLISEDWTQLSIPGIEEWKDARLNVNEKIYDAWFAETSKDRYLKQSSELFKILGFEK